MNNINLTALFKKSDRNISRDSSIFDIGNQIAYGKIESLFNEGFYLLNSKHVKRDQENFYLLHKSNISYGSFFENQSEKPEDCDAALILFEKIISIDPNEKFGHLYAGICKRLNGEDSHEYFVNSIEIDPDFSDGFCNLAIVVSKNPYFAEWFPEAFAGLLITFDMCIDLAFYMFQKAIELDPKNSTAFFKRGVLNWEQNNFEEALYDLDMAYKLYSKKLYVLYNRGCVKKKLNDLLGAINDFTGAVENDHRDWQAYHMRANCELAVKNFEAAITDFTHAIRINPKSDRTYLSRGQLLRNKGNYELAIEDFNSVIELENRDASAYYFRGLCHNSLGKPKLTLFDLRKAVSLDPDNDVFKRTLQQAESQL